VTPAETRDRARRNLKSAHTLLADDDADKAAYLAGEAVELILKARYCVLNGLPGLPSDNKDLRQHGLQEHDLDKLLTLSESAHIQWRAMNEIDWSVASDHNNQDRYTRPGSISKERAAERIAQTERLLDGLVEYEVVEACQAVALELATQGVTLNLIAWCLTQEGKWTLIAASLWFDCARTRVRRMAQLVSMICARLQPDLHDLIKNTLDVFGVSDPVPTTFYHLALQMDGGGLRLENSTFLNFDRMPPPRGRLENSPLLVKNVRASRFEIESAYLIEVDTTNLVFR